MISLNIIRVKLVGVAFTRSTAYGTYTTRALQRKLSTTTATRLKREDLRHTKYDSAFSNWKVLVGESDWKDHSMGKGGAERYRTQNLPNCTRCPGVYELGVTIQCPARARLFLELDPTFISVIYVGETDDVRTRLQQYGRNGAHLKKLFSETFSKGRLAIVYRWAYMKSKKHAQETEAQLLKENDYPWNEKSNGERRPVDDIHRKLEYCLPNNTSQFSLLHKIMLQYLHQKQVDIELNFEQFLISLCKSIMNASWLQPKRGVQSCCGDDRNRIGNICGVCIGHGSVCTKPPVKGRKRCAEHKGMKVIGFIS